MSSANNYVNQIMITWYVMEVIYKEHFYQIKTLEKTKLVIHCILDSIQKLNGLITRLNNEMCISSWPIRA